jgi:hypothetical protein
LLFVNNTPQLIPIKQKKRIHQKGRKATTEWATLSDLHLLRPALFPLLKPLPQRREVSQSQTLTTPLRKNSLIPISNSSNSERPNTSNPLFSTLSQRWVTFLRIVRSLSFFISQSLRMTTIISRHSLLISSEHLRLINTRAQRREMMTGLTTARKRSSSRISSI